MHSFASIRLPVERTEVAPDGSDVRVLLILRGGGMAHFQLGSGETSKATTHRTVEEIWFFLTGRGEMWRELEGKAEIVEISPGLCLTIPLGTRFQFRSVDDEPLSALGVTMPPWPGEGEAILVDGPWQSTVSS